MIVLGLNGSPHREGNTAELLRVALEAAAEMGVATETLYLQEILDKLDKPHVPLARHPVQGYVTGERNWSRLLRGWGRPTGF